MTSPAVLTPRGRQRLPFPFGQGLDRATGALVGGAGALADVRNLYGREAKLAVRPGLGGSGFAAYGWGTDVVGLFPLATTRDVIAVVYDRASRDLRVYRHNPVGLTTQLVATWGTLNASAPLPLVHAAEYGGVLLLAHDEATYGWRLATQVYAPGVLDTDAGTIADLTADLDGDGTAGALRFRGVVRYLDYVFGWGFGTETSAATANRSEVLRHCVPGDPSAWSPEGYFLVGARGDAILCAGPAGGAGAGVLLVEKAASTHAVVGTAPDDFGLVQLDDRFGVAGPRLGITVGGRRYTWSAAGPRVSDGGPSVDLALPLELDGPEPTTLAAKGATAAGWAAYDEDRRLLLFGFPDAVGAAAPTRVYAASLHASPPQWSYLELQQCVSCVGEQWLGKAPPPPITGYASAVTATDVGIDPSDPSVRRVTIAWTNTGASGDESVEIQLRAQGTSTWELLPTGPVGGATQSLTVSGGAPLTAYDVAIRYVRGTETGAGYGDPNPDNWTAPTAAGAKATVTTGCSTPTLVSVAGWVRTSPTTTSITLTWTLADTHAPVLVQRSDDGGATWVDVVALDGSTTPRAYTYAIPAGQEFTVRRFRIRPQRGATGAPGTVAGTASNVIAAYLGPSIGTGTLFGLWRIGPTSARYVVQAPTSPAPSALQVDVSSNGGTTWVTAYSGAVHFSGWDVFSDQPTRVPVPAFHPALASPGGASDITLQVRWRYGVPGTAGTDWGDWGTTSIALASTGVTYPLNPTTPASVSVGWADAQPYQTYSTQPGATPVTGTSPSWSVGRYGRRVGPTQVTPVAGDFTIVGCVATTGTGAGSTGLAMVPASAGVALSYEEPTFGPTSEATWLVGVGAGPIPISTSRGFFTGAALEAYAFFVSASGPATAGPWFDAGDGVVVP